MFSTALIFSVVSPSWDASSVASTCTTRKSMSSRSRVSMAALPLAVGKPVLMSTATSVHLGDADLHLVSSTAFDLGVLMVVVGVAIGMISRLDEEAER